MSTSSVSGEILDYVMDDEAEMFKDDLSDIECLQTRKWWCFLLSSICTFLMGIFSVLFVRAFAALFCRKVNIIFFVFLLILWLFKSLVFNLVYFQTFVISN